jgi:hypothetical protein
MFTCTFAVWALKTDLQKAGDRGAERSPSLEGWRIRQDIENVQTFSVPFRVFRVRLYKELTLERAYKVQIEFEGGQLFQKPLLFSDKHLSLYLAV